MGCKWELVESSYSTNSHLKPTKPQFDENHKKHWNILQCSEVCKKLFPELPIIAYRRNWNLRDHLIRANLVKPIRTNAEKSRFNNKCTKENCVWCRQLRKSNVIASTTTGWTAKGPNNINCQSNNLVYILTCLQCSKQYIGETGRLFIQRWKEHLYDIRSKRPYPVATQWPGISMKMLIKCWSKLSSWAWSKDITPKQRQLENTKRTGGSTLVNYHWDHIPHFGHISEPLYKFLCKRKSG